MEKSNFKQFMAGVLFSTVSFLTWKIISFAVTRKKSIKNSNFNNTININGNPAIQTTSTNSGDTKLNPNDFEIKINTINLVLDTIISNTLIVIKEYYIQFDINNGEETIKKYTKSETIEKLEKFDTELLSKLKLNISSFFTAYMYYHKTDENFKRHADFLVNIKNQFLESTGESLTCFNIDLPQQLTENILKIISNILYLNILYTYLEYKTIYIDKIHGCVPNKEPNFNQIYNSNLEQTRQDVFKYFSIPDKISGIKTQHFLQIYPYTLERDDEIRQKFNKYSKYIEKIMENMILKKFPKAFVQQGNNYMSTAYVVNVSLKY